MAVVSMRCQFGSQAANHREALALSAVLCCAVSQTVAGSPVLGCGRSVIGHDVTGAGGFSGWVHWPNIQWVLLLSVRPLQPASGSVTAPAQLEGLLLGCRGTDCSVRSSGSLRRCSYIWSSSYITIYHAVNSLLFKTERHQRVCECVKPFHGNDKKIPK